MEGNALSQRLAELAADRKALAIKIIDVRGRCGYADYLVLASGTSDRHVQSIAELAEQEVKQAGVRSIGREGLREGQWALIDYGNVVLHVFHQFTRAVYDLDGLWRDAPQTWVGPPPGPQDGPPSAAADDLQAPHGPL